MGNNMSLEQKSVLELMGKILAKQGTKIDTNNLKRLLLWASKEYPSITKTTVYNSQVWDAIGIKLWDATIHYNSIAVSLLRPWRTLFKALKAQGDTKTSEKEQLAPLDSAEPMKSLPTLPPVQATPLDSAEAVKHLFLTLKHAQLRVVINPGASCLWCL